MRNEKSFHTDAGGGFAAVADEGESRNEVVSASKKGLRLRATMHAEDVDLLVADGGGGRGGDGGGGEVLSSGASRWAAKEEVPHPKTRDPKP